MSTEHPQLSQGSQIDGFTVGGLVRSRNGAATYDATDASGQAVHLTVYADACFPSGLVRDKALRELGQLQGAAAPEVAKVQACGKYGEGIYEVTEVVAGETLREAAAMSDQDAAAIVASVGTALLAGEQHNVMHRNLGLDNIVRTSGGVKVVGFAVSEPQEGGARGPSRGQAKGASDQRTLAYNVAALMCLTSGVRCLVETRRPWWPHRDAEAPGDVHATLKALART